MSKVEETGENTNSPTCDDRHNTEKALKMKIKSNVMGRAHTTEENGKWGETKQRSENQVAFNSVLGPS
jgi:hypothetical protein